MSGVYAIRNIRTGAVYVGSTHHLPKRWTQHCSFLSRGRHPNQRLQKAWDQDGQEAFVIELLEPVVPPDHAALDEAEARHFARFQDDGVPLYSRKYYPRSRGWYQGMPYPPIAVGVDSTEADIAAWLELSRITVRTWLESGLIVRANNGATLPVQVANHGAPGATSARTPALLYRRTRTFLSQQELALRAGVNPASVHRGEHGHPLRLAVIRKLAAALGCRPADLMRQPPEQL